jgi:hypothetical protein
MMGPSTRIAPGVATLATRAAGPLTSSALTPTACAWR